MLLTVIITLTILYILHYVWPLYFWRKQGVGGPLPLPIVGHSLKLINKSPRQIDLENVSRYGHVYFDHLPFSSGPTLTITDIKLIKEILVKNFFDFSGKIAFPSAMPYFDKSLIFIDGKQWKRIRAIVSPIFTSARLRQICDQLLKPVTLSVNLYEQQVNAKGGKAKLNVKRMSYFVTVDIIGKLVFSMDVDCFRNQQTPFLQNVFLLNSFSLMSVLVMSVVPKFVIQSLNLTPVRLKSVNYFADLTKSLINERKKHPETRYEDFLQLLVESEADTTDGLDQDWEKQPNKLTTEEIIGQCLFFFLAGVNTISANIAFVLHQLAKHQDIQDDLFRQLWTTFPNEHIKIEDLNQCPLLNNVVLESERMTPSVTKLFRRATRDSTLSNGIRVKKGQLIAIPVYALQNHEDYFDDPFEFKPERFENMDNEIRQYAFLPFSSGPMNCVGMRFAIMEVKFYLISFLKKFRVELCADGSTEIKDKKVSFLYIVDDLYLDVSRR